MQPIAHVLSKPLNPAAARALPAPLPVQMVESLFQRLTGQLGAKVADLFAGVKPEIVKAEWGDGLAGFTDAEILRGLKACQARVFAPTLGEFCRMCRPALDPETAWIEASLGMKARDRGEHGEWSHPAVFRAAQGLSYELRARSFPELRKVWTYRLEREFEKGWGDDVPAPGLRIEQQEAKTRPPTPAELASYRALVKGARASMPQQGGV